MKHAYLILAHSNPELLQSLVSALDDERNDIFVHWDANSGAAPEIHADRSGLVVLKDRVRVFWADYSMVEAELALFGAAYDPGTYSYYHLLSGVDVPVKTQDYIHSWCDTHPGVEYVGFSTPAKGEIDWRTQHRFIFTNDFRNPSLLKKTLRAVFVKAQDIVGYRRHGEDVRKGPQWFSATSDFIGYILDNKDYIRRMFRHTFVPDEMFVQTLLWNSEFRDRAYDLEDEFEGCKRYIKWVNGELKDLRAEEVEDMVRSPRWFARKMRGGDLGMVAIIKDKLDEQNIGNSTCL